MLFVYGVIVSLCFMVASWISRCLVGCGLSVLTCLICIACLWRLYSVDCWSYFVVIWLWVFGVVYCAGCVGFVVIVALCLRGLITSVVCCLY